MGWRDGGRVIGGAGRGTDQRSKFAMPLAFGPGSDDVGESGWLGSTTQVDLAMRMLVAPDDIA